MRVNKILKDINRIDEVINENNQDKAKELYEELRQTYKGEIKDLDKSLLEITSSADFFHNLNADDYNQRPIREFPENIVKNHKIIKGKLELLSNEHPQSKNTGVNLTVKNENINTLNTKLDVDINITYENVRDQIKSMDSILDENVINEILQKISELEDIIESKDNKSTKWGKARAIGKWVFDKSVDVGISLLPLFLKIGQ